VTATSSPRSRGLSLGTRIFLIMGFLIVVAVGVAVAVTFYLGNRIARGAVGDALKGSAAAQASFEQLNYDRLEAISQLFASDPAVAAYLAEAAENQDLLSIRNLLTERQQDLGFDFAILLDPAGRVIVRSDRTDAGGEDLSKRPLVSEVLSRYRAKGVWAEQGALYYAVGVPVVVGGFDLVGFLVTGFQIDEVLASDISRASGTEVVYLATPAQGEPQVVASTPRAALRSAELTRWAAQMASRGGGGGEPKPLDVTLGGRPWQALFTPLADAAGKPVGALIALESLDQQLAPYEEIQKVLLLVGGGSILIALFLSYALSRRTLGPVRRLAAAATAARQGNYDQRLTVERGDEVGLLARAFDELLSDLREKRDMESYLGELARNLPEPGRVAGAAEPRVRDLTLVAVELRRYARAETVADPERALERIGRDLRRASAAITAHHGRLEAVSGHRLLASFDGDGKSQRALAAAAEVLAAAAAREDAFDEPVEPLVVLASGKATTGSAVWGEGPQQAVLGLPVQKVESLLREATQGEILLTKEVFRELEATLAAAGVQVTPQQGVVSPLPLFSVDPQAAARLSGVDLAAAAAPTVVTERSAILADLAPGKVLGSRFELLTVLGGGGMGVVYKARDRELGDLVALKVLKRELWEDTTQLERLKDELRLARKITHPNVLRTYDFGELDGIHFISMEYVRGVTLRYMLDQSERLPFSAGLRVSKQLCAGLAAAHAQGVVHRDIKPDNLILDQAGNAKLMDFGIARPITRQGPGVTQEGWVVGTPQFMAPEQLEGRPVDARTDVYSTGVVLYEIFTGRLPFTGATAAQVMLQHLNDTPPAPRQFWADIPQRLEAAILKCLDKTPGQRYANAEALLAELERVSA
jgi:eukaryotic-like serine/threonine-protein kinase